MVDQLLAGPVGDLLSQRQYLMANCAFDRIFVETFNLLLNTLVDEGRDRGLRARHRNL